MLLVLEVRSPFHFCELHNPILKMCTKKICFWSSSRRSAVDKCFSSFLVQTVRILLVLCWENWIQTIRSGSWKKELNSKKWEIHVGDPHGSLLDHPCHLCFGDIIFCHCCFMYLIFVSSYIKWKSLREGLH